MANNRLIIVGNGFDLAHGLKTSYRDFMNWYMCSAFEKFDSTGNYSDLLIEIKRKYAGQYNVYNTKPKTVEEVLDYINVNDYQSLSYKSKFFERLIESHLEKKWVDIEIYYFRYLKSFFNRSARELVTDSVLQLNTQFDYIISKLADYLNEVNIQLQNVKQLPISDSRSNLKKVIEWREGEPVIFLNFNYTDTLLKKIYAHNEEILHIHGQASNKEANPIIFGYGDESDPIYQQIEDSGENMFLEHIKSFGYFQTTKYHELLSFIDSAKYDTFIVGHSCGLSDRVLLNQIFEHPNCEKIEIFYHQKKDGSDNFKEITQEISRHFKPQNKNLMRRRMKDKQKYNFIPQLVL